MQHLIDRIKNLSISDEFKTKIIQDIFMAFVNQAGAIAFDRFTQEDKAAIQEAAKNNDYQRIVDELQKHFSEEEWNSLVIPKLESIAKSYEEEVLSVLA
jgi:hypothetical protein